MNAWDVDYVQSSLAYRYKYRDQATFWTFCLEVDLFLRTTFRIHDWTVLVKSLKVLADVSKLDPYPPSHLYCKVRQVN